MTLFEIDPDTNRVRLNKPWIGLVPELAVLIKRDKGESRKEMGKSIWVYLKAIKEFTFIYFYVDFGSPIYDYEDGERKKEALYYADLKEEDLDDKVWTAVKKYEEMMIKAARSLRTYKALLKMMDAMDSYMENLDMAAITKTGELRNSPDKIAATVGKMDTMHTAIENFRRRVDSELKQQGSIRGTAVLGDNELGTRKSWSEAEIASGSAHAAEGSSKADISTGRSYDHMMKILQTVPKDIPDEEEDNE